MINKLFPNKILSLNNKFFIHLIFLMISVIIIGLVYALLISPPDIVQGNSVRIMYIHVPASFIGISCYTFMGSISILSLVFKIKVLPYIAKSIAPVGFVFALVSIISGSLWGKPTWGVWWAWDARLTSMLILNLLYIFYILSWKLIKQFEKANKVSSFIAVIGLLNIPIVKYSVDWWNTLHQTSSITLSSAPSIHYTMLIPLLIMFFGLIIYSLILILMKYKIEILKLKLKRNKDY
jgi:heme exporter protein C